MSIFNDMIFQQFGELYYLYELLTFYGDHPEQPASSG